MDEFTTKEVAEILTITLGRLRGWVDEFSKHFDVFKPSVSGARGSGHKVLYSKSDVLFLKLFRYFVNVRFIARFNAAALTDICQYFFEKEGVTWNSLKCIVIKFESANHGEMINLESFEFMNESDILKSIDLKKIFEQKRIFQPKTNGDKEMFWDEVVFINVEKMKAEVDYNIETFITERKQLTR